jgi:hypothetical protein
MRDRQLESLWRDAPTASEHFDPAAITHLPQAARRYLEHTLAPGTPLARAARLEMHGEIRLDGTWSPFTATQVLRWDRGFVWHAHTTVKGLPVSGADREIDGEGAMKWKLLGIVPVMSARGPEVTRSAAGRLHAEAIWLPGALLDPGVSWSEEAGRPAFTIDAHGEKTRVELDVGPSGELRAMKLARWGGVDGGGYRYVDFGGSAAADRTFAGVTIPTEYRIGWYFGSDRFETEGEFFRCTLDSFEHR